VSGPSGTKLLQVTLTNDAVKRLGLRTTGVADQAGTKVVPYSAIVYDGHGASWVYTRVHPRSYLRAPVTIESIEGETVLLAAGPDTGTPVVTVGAAELLGTEQGIGS
jgi:hypothetical protein